MLQSSAASNQLPVSNSSIISKYAKLNRWFHNVSVFFITKFYSVIRLFFLVQVSIKHPRRSCFLYHFQTPQSWGKNIWRIVLAFFLLSPCGEVLSLSPVWYISFYNSHAWCPIPRQLEQLKRFTKRITQTKARQWNRKFVITPARLRKVPWVTDLGNKLFHDFALSWECLEIHLYLHA